MLGGFAPALLFGSFKLNFAAGPLTNVANFVEPFCQCS